MSKIFRSLVITFIFSACAVGPNYERPEVRIPSTFDRASLLEERLGESNVIDFDPSAAHWWRNFNDPFLHDLISQVASDNLSIQASIERISEAKALTRQTFFGLFPQPAVFTSYNKSKIAAARFPGIARSGIEAEIFSLGGEASWEIDLFGRVRRQIEVADSNTESIIFSAIDTLRITEAELAKAYIELRGYQSLKRNALKNLEKQNNLLALINKRFEVGDIGPIDKELASAQTKTIEASIPSFQTNIDAALNRIASLLGKHVSELDQKLIQDKKIPTYVGPASIGNPSLLLKTRPDVRIAEEQAHAAVANVGVNVAELFPQVNFTGSFTNDARKTRDWFTGASEAYSYGPRISWNIVNLGVVLNQIDSSKAGARAALLEYQQTVLSALEESEVALSTLANLITRTMLLEDAYTSNSEAERVSELQYDAGTLAYFDLLEAQRRALISESDFIRSKMEESLAYVGLYRAIGGGWIGPETTDKELMESVEERI